MKVFFTFVIAVSVYQASGFVLKSFESLPEDHDSCDTCKNFFGDVRDRVEANETRQEIIAYVKEHLCNNITILRIKPVCNFLTRILVGPTMKALAREIAPQTICEDIEFCEIPETSVQVENELYGWRHVLKTLKAEYLK